MRISDWSSDVYSSDLVITGTLEAHGAYKTVGDVTTFDFIRIHGDDGRDHLLKLVRAAEYMFSYLLTEDLHGTFVVADKQSPIVVGLRYGGQVYEDVLPWPGNATFWKRVTLFFVRSEEHTSELQSLMRI